MPLAVVLSANDLAALLSSRICHDLISPVSAINNAIELFDEGGAEDDALALIRMSAASASAKLQFARLAYGASGSSKSEVDTGDAENVAKELMLSEKATLEWNAPRLILPKNQVKLMLNLLLVANGSIPRGGDIHFELSNDGSQFSFKVTGKMLRIPSKFMELYNNTLSEEIDAHGIQFYYTFLLADVIGKKIDIQSNDQEIIFKVS